MSVESMFWSCNIVGVYCKKYDFYDYWYWMYSSSCITESSDERESDPRPLRSLSILTHSSSTLIGEDHSQGPLNDTNDETEDDDDDSNESSQPQ